MVRTVIVDDDFLVRSYLKGLESWNKAGYEIIADVRDGEEALLVTQEKRPDVIVTDISMPLMNGIELIRRIRQFNQEIYIIVLSCHDDFEYVKEAMKLGANEYVLKNALDENTLYELLKNSEKQIESQRAKSSDQERTRKLIRMGSQSLKFHFFNRLLSGTMTAEEREQKRAEAGIRGKFINSAVIDMFIPQWSEIKTQLSPVEMEQYTQLFLSSLTEQLENLLGEDSEYVEVIYLGEGIFCCFLDLSSMCSSSLMKQKLASVASACFKCCKGEPYRYSVGVSNICIGDNGVYQAYQQAREMTKLKFYEDRDVLFFDTQITIGKQMPQSANELLDKINSYLAGKKKDEMQGAFTRVIADCRKTYVDSKLVVHWVHEMDTIVHAERSREDYTKIIKIEQLQMICDGYWKKTLADYTKEIPKGVSAVVKQAIDYIHSHYKNPIGLREVADHVSLNSAYLSYLFKQEMGVGFSNYLLDCRMDCAKSLLRDTNYKIKDVASESGFHDYHYFSKAFKKLNGCSPAEYRKDNVLG